jgi:hypothetical protein
MGGRPFGCRGCFVTGRWADGEPITPEIAEEWGRPHAGDRFLPALLGNLLLLFDRILMGFDDLAVTDLTAPALDLVL